MSRANLNEVKNLLTIWRTNLNEDAYCLLIQSLTVLLCTRTKVHKLYNGSSSSHVVNISRKERSYYPKHLSHTSALLALRLNRGLISCIAVHYFAKGGGSYIKIVGAKVTT